MKKIIKKILKEDRQEQFLNKIILLMKDEYPIYKKLNDYGFKLSEKELKYVFSGIFGETVEIEDNSIYDENDNRVYWENQKYWSKWEYDDKGNKIYYERHNGFWEKQEYDDNGNEIYYESSEGYWEKREYDSKGNYMYYEDSDGDIRDYR